VTESQNKQPIKKSQERQNDKTRQEDRHYVSARGFHFNNHLNEFWLCKKWHEE
jgi:hypothetical protein